jgi:hypothetical protein
MRRLTLTHDAVVTRHTGPSHKMTSNRRQQVQQGTTTTTTQTAPAAPGAQPHSTRAQTLRNDDAIRQHMHTVHHLGASNTSPSTTTTTASWAGSLMGSSAMPS